jgi:hypothetical protein
MMPRRRRKQLALAVFDLILYGHSVVDMRGRRVPPEQWPKTSVARKPAESRRRRR